MKIQADNIIVNTKTISLFEVKVNSLPIVSIKLHKKGKNLFIRYDLYMLRTYSDYITVQKNSKIKISMFNVLGIVFLLVF